MKNIDRNLPIKNNLLLDVARELRRNMTPQERHLWYDYLQHYPIKIYKQRIIGNYIADFYCHRARVVIELDGAPHFTPRGKYHDNARDNVLNYYGILVLRFNNSEVDSRFYEVCRIIDEKIKARVADL